MIINLDCGQFVSAFREDDENINYPKKPLFVGSIKMQDKRVSHNEAGYSDKHQPAVPFGDFEMYSIFDSAVPILLQIAIKIKIFQ